MANRISDVEHENHITTQAHTNTLREMFAIWWNVIRIDDVELEGGVINHLKIFHEDCSEGLFLIF
jgi:hypothetical protein